MPLGWFAHELLLKKLGLFLKAYQFMVFQLKELR